MNIGLFFASGMKHSHFTIFFVHVTI